MKKIVICLLMLLASAGASAATYNMTTTRPPCSSNDWDVAGSTYTCDSGTITLASGDVIVSGTGNPITVVGEGGVTLAGNNTIGSASANVAIRTTYGALTASGSGTVVYGNVTANSGAISLTSATVNGNVTTNGTVTLSGGTVTGNVSGGNGVTTSNGTIINGNVASASGSIALSGGSVGGAVSSNCCTVTTTNTNVVNGVSSSNNTVSISGGTVAGPISSSGGSGVIINNATVSSGSITAGNVGISISNSTIGSPSSPVNVTGNNTVAISNGSSVYGDVTAGNWSSAMNIDSSSTVYGVCQSNSNSISTPSQYPRCASAVPLAEWRMDESSWNGTAGEVRDSIGSYHGVAARAAGNGSRPTTATGSPAYTSSSTGLTTCRYGEFDRTSSPARTYTYVQLGSFPSLPGPFTFAGWIRTTDRTASGQRILVRDDDNNDGGWGLSLGDGGTGTLRLFNRTASNTGNVSGDGQNGDCGVFCIDTDNVVTNNAWFFVAATINTATKDVTLYVFNQSGVRQARVTGKYSGTWGSGSGLTAIGGETASSSEGTQSGFHFRGNIDELKVYGSALTETALRGELTRSRSCTSTAVHHYELRLPATSLTCVPNLVTVVACTDSATPCNNFATAVAGQSAALATSAGSSLGDSLVTFGTSGSVSTTLRYPTAAEDATATVTLSNESVGAQAARVCCVGNSCSVASSCATTFKTAGFVFSNSATGDPVDIPSQIAGSSSATYYLRAVRRSNTSTSACEAALTGTKAVDFGYECYGNPSTCDANNRMTVSGTTIARNDKGTTAVPVSSYLPVNLTFEADGSAKFTFTYGDVGQLRLWVRKAADTTTVPPLLTTLTATSNAFVVKPYDFGFTNTSGSSTIVCGSGTGSTTNPAAADANGSKFCAAGNPFSATVRARTASGATTPSFGRCDSTTGSCATETVALTQTLVAPSGGESPALSGISTANALSFSGGSYTFSNLSWNEVGIIRLKAANGNYLSNSLAPCGSNPAPGDVCQGSYGDSGNVGRFYPRYFKLEVTPPIGCSGFIYGGHTEAGPTVLLGQPMTVKVTAKYGTADTAITQNYSTARGFSKNINLTLAAGGGTGNLFIDAVSGGTNAVPASKFTSPGVGTVNHDDASGKVSYVFNAAAPTALLLIPTMVTVHADDTDYPVAAPSANTGDATIQARFGRLRLFNAFGAGRLPLEMQAQTQYWSGKSWIQNSADSCTTLAPENFFLSSNLTSVTAPMVINGGTRVVRLAAPVGGAMGNVDIAANLGSTINDHSCLLSPPQSSRISTPGKLPWLRSRHGSNASCAGGTYDRDPSARASFGIYSPENTRIIHMREFF